METETEKKTAVTRMVLYILCSLLLVFMIYFTVMAILGPSRTITSIDNEYGFKSTEKSKIDETIFKDSAFIANYHERSYYQARVLMAESDSICLALDLPDSTAILEINGVTVHKSKISVIAVSKVFRKVDEYSITAMLATPFTIQNDFSTIKKEPVMIKIAPKDTSEYKPDILPDTTRSEAVNYIFEMNNGTRIYIYQDTDENKGERMNLFLFDLNDRLRNFTRILKSLISFKVPEYYPSIKLRMAKADAKIIYRALPKHGMIAVYSRF